MPRRCRRLDFQDLQAPREHRTKRPCSEDDAVIGPLLEACHRPLASRMSDGKPHTLAALFLPLPLMRTIAASLQAPSVFITDRALLTYLVETALAARVLDATGTVRDALRARFLHLIRPSKVVDLFLALQVQGVADLYEPGRNEHGRPLSLVHQVHPNLHIPQLTSEAAWLYTSILNDVTGQLRPEALQERLGLALSLQCMFFRAKVPESLDWLARLATYGGLPDKPTFRLLVGTYGSSEYFSVFKPLVGTLYELLRTTSCPVPPLEDLTPKDLLLYNAYRRAFVTLDVIYPTDVRLFDVLDRG